MTRRAVVLLTGAACILGPASASACDLYFNSVFLRQPVGRLAIGAGAQIQTGDPTTTIFSGDLSIKLGQKAVVRPGVGLCRQGGGPGFQSSSALTIGSGLGVRLWNSPNGGVAINGQAGFAYVSSDGATDLTFPIGAAADFKASDQVSVFAGAALKFSRFSYTGGSQTDSDPVLYGGVTINLKRADLTAGITLQNGDTDTATAINVGLRVPVGKS